MGTNSEVMESLSGPTRSVRRAALDAWAGFGKLHDAALSDGALPAKAKELLALAVVNHCDGCIAYHAKAAARRGTTPAEVAETLSVAMLMDGGPATTHGPRAWAAYHEFSQLKAPRPDR